MTERKASVVAVSRKVSFRILTLIVTMILILSATVSVFAASKPIEVTIKDGTKSVSITTTAKDPQAIISSAGLKLNRNDDINLDKFDSQNGGTIVINRSKLLKVSNNGIVSFFSDFGNGSKKQEKDEEINSNEKYYINNASTVTIVCDDKTIKVAVLDCTVEDALEKADIEVGNNDIVSPSLDTYITKNTKIVVKRVTYKTRKESVDIPYEIKNIPVPEMYVNEAKVTKKGKVGSKTVYYKDKYIDGEYVSSDVSREIVRRRPTTEVRKVGVKKLNYLSAYKNSGTQISEIEKPSSVVINSTGAPEEYQYCINGKATAYTGGTLTSCGQKPKPGYIAVNPKQIPYGSELYIVSADGTYIYGYAIAADTGGFVKMGNTTIDLYMNDRDMCLEWGNRPVKIYVL